jgi:hypothetical protein
LPRIYPKATQKVISQNKTRQALATNIGAAQFALHLDAFGHGGNGHRIFFEECNGENRNKNAKKKLSAERFELSPPKRLRPERSALDHSAKQTVGCLKVK